VTRRPTDVRKRESGAGSTRTRKGRAIRPAAEVKTASEVPLLTAEVVHRTNGRLRVKVPAKKGDSAFFEAAAEKLAECPGVEKVEVNPVTASILFALSTTPERINRFAERKGLFRLAPWRPVRKTIFADVADLFRKWNRALKESSGGDLDIPSLVFVSLVISGVYQIARGNLSMPAWYTAFYYALGVFSRGFEETPDEGPNIVEDIEDNGGFLGDLGEEGGD
jgi:hypothetical protein